MRKQTKKLRELLDEFNQLKEEIFGTAKFVVVDDGSVKQKRYDQLFQFFYPQFRTKNFVSPL